jgi:hypothetical protein
MNDAAGLIECAYVKSLAVHTSTLSSANSGTVIV